RDLYEFRLLIEPQAAGWMAEYADAAEVAELTALADRMGQLAEDDAALLDLMEADRIFHDLVSRASDNDVVAAVSRDIREVIGTLWGFSAMDATAVGHVAEQHQLIAAAVAQRDPQAAAESMRDHLLWAARADLHGLGEPFGLRLFTGTKTA
ncbi:MAG: FadR/GntR family transcriptional regulator, partial [Gaiella sp.]